MSTNEPARLQSRRAFLSTTAAAAAIGASAVRALPAEPDPILPLIKAERLAWDAVEKASAACDKAEQALWGSEWDRPPRVKVATYTPIVRGPDFEQIPFNEWVGQPIYVHDHAAIDKDCDSYARGPCVAAAEVEKRRACLHRELDEDAAAIAAAPEVIAEKHAERLNDVAGDAHAAALTAVFDTAPTTGAGTLALLDLFEERSGHGCELSAHLPPLFAALRTVIGRA